MGDQTVMEAGGIKSNMNDSSYFDQMRMPGDTEFSKQGPDIYNGADLGLDDDLIGGLGVADQTTIMSKNAPVDPNKTVM